VPNIRSRKSLYLAAASTLILGAGWALLRDVDRYRPQFAAELSQSLQRQVELRGSLRLSLFPFGLRAENVLVREADGRGEFLNLRRIQIGVGRWAAVRGHWQVTRISADGVRLQLRRDTDGALNIDDLLQAPPTARLGWALQDVDIDDVTLLVDDLAAKQQWHVGRASLEGHREQADGPLLWSLGGEVEHPHATGTLKLKGDIHVDRRQHLLQLPNLQLAWLGQAEGARTVLELNGDVEYRRRFATLQHARIRFDAKRGPTRLQVNGELPYAAWREARLQAPQLVLRGSLARPLHTGTLQIDWRNLSAAEHGLQADSVIRFGATQDNRELQLQLRGPLLWRTSEQRFQLAHNRLEGVLRQVGQPQPSAQLLLQGDAALDWAAQSIDAHLAGLLDRGPLRLDFSLQDFGAPRLKLDADLARLDLNPFLFVSNSTTAQALETPEQANTPTRLDLSWLQGWRASGALRIGEMQLGRLNLQRVQLGLHAGDGNLLLEPLMANLYGGTLLGSAQLQFSPQPQLQIRQTLANMNISEMLQDLLGTSRLEGVGDARLDLRLEGADSQTLKRSLSGRVELAVKQGALRGINIGQAMGLAGSGREHAVQQVDPEARTAFTALQASFNLDQGVAVTDDLQLVSPLLAIRGDGRIDWPGDMLQYRLLATLESSKAKPGKKSGVDLSGVQVPLTIEGPLASPRYAADLRPLIERLAQAGKTAKK
jgi:AsmA protein